MAAGLGTRLRPFTLLEPKALLPLLGVPMAQFAIDAAIAAGVDRIVANIHHHPDRVADGLKRLERGTAELALSDESAELLGSAGGLRNASGHFRRDEPFFLLNSDVVCDVDLGALARTHARLRSRSGVQVTLTVYPKPPLALGEVQREGYREILFDRSTGLITGLGEKALGRPYFVGAAVIEPSALTGVPAQGPAEFVPSILIPAIQMGKAGVHLADGLWYDVGSPALWLQAHLGLLAALETGALSRGWRRRIERINRRVASETWVAQDASTRVLRNARWAGPAYWNPLRDSTATAPLQLGPRAVLYGTASGISRPFSDGIGFRGVWETPGL